MKKFIVGLVCLLQLAMIANAQLVLKLDKPQIAAKPIAIVPFANNTQQDKIEFIVASDLKQSGVFSPISPQSYVQRPQDTAGIDYAEFDQLGTNYVVVGNLESTAQGQVVRFAIADSVMKQLIGSYAVAVKEGNLRHTAHQVSDIILQKITGIRGAFAGKLAYVHESGQGSNRQYSIMVSDSDGQNSRTVVSSKLPLMSPRFSSQGNKLAYVSFEGQRSQINVIDLASGQTQTISKEFGINSAPAWSADDSKIAMVLSKDGNSEIYYKNLTSGQLVRVTDNPGIDTEPTWSADSNSLYFTSDRSNVPMLYRINLQSGQLTKVGSSGQYSARADVSYDGKKLALTRSQNGQFVIGTIDLDSNQFLGVSTGFLDETPRFSPNAQMIIFTSVENGKQVLRIVNVDGSGENTLSSSGHIRDPDWSTAN